MSEIQKTFRALDMGDGSDGRWAAHLRTLFPRAEGWLTDDGRTADGALRARKLFEEHMPELVPLLDRLAEQVDRPAAGTFLTMADPKIKSRQGMSYRPAARSAVGFPARSAG